jgi:hypothetical protein
MHAHLNDPKDQPPSDTNEPRKYVKKLPSLPSLCLNYGRDESLDQSDYPLKRAKNAHCLEKLRDNSHNHVGFLGYNTQTALLACLRRLVQPHEDSISLSTSLTVSERYHAVCEERRHQLQHYSHPESMHAPTVRQRLACDVQHDGHMHRYLFDDDTVRHIKVMTSLQAHHFHDQPLPPMPAGNWNWATIDVDPKTGQPAFQTAIRRHLEGVRTTRTKTWDPPSVDHLDLQLYQGSNSSGRFATYRDSPSNIFGCQIVVKIARFVHEIPDIQLECDVYEKILGKGIGPKFLAYVTEGGRVIGFVLKKIEGARCPRPRDFNKCKRVLQKLHKLGFLHRDYHHGNILMKKGRAILVDFKSALVIISANAAERKKQDLETLRAACGIFA